MEGLARILVGLQGVFGNYGLAIIALTFLVRIILIPLTLKQTKSMREIQRLQPKIKAIQEKYKKDKQKQQEELMKFYKEHKFNPLGGCLPMILQLPIFFALFRVLLGQGETGMLKTVAVGLSKSSFLGLGLSKNAWAIIKVTFGGAITLGGIWTVLPYLLMVVAMGASQWWSNKIMGGEDPQQARMMNMMLLFLIFIGFTLPAGVIIYWITTNVLTGVQHVITMKFLPEEKPAKA